VADPKPDVSSGGRPTDEAGSVNAANAGNSAGAGQGHRPVHGQIT
jgi:hypothetical protein